MLLQERKWQKEGEKCYGASNWIKFSDTEHQPVNSGPTSILVGKLTVHTRKIQLALGTQVRY